VHAFRLVNVFADETPFAWRPAPGSAHGASGVLGPGDAFALEMRAGIVCVQVSAECGH
jgi:hypothetical protein